MLAADLTWTGERFAPDLQVEIGADGRITRVGALGLAPTQRLARRALLPGFVNAHSHAFQRGLRGFGERFPGGAGSFWSWREAMYDLVTHLDVPRFRALCERAFREMLAVGITTVGEFHYLHHHHAGRRDWAFDEAVIAAARAAGIRLVLLETYYRTGGIGRALEGGQLHFATPDLDAYWRQFDQLNGARDAAWCTLGVVAHSVRAASPEEIGELHAEASRRGLPFHLHLAEQRREIEECVAAYGKRPMILLQEQIDDASNVTAVHCTHTTPGGMRSFVAAGGRVCVCPLTEGNLGDGLPDLAEARTVPGRLALGTDSNARIAMLDEMRWLEYGQRLRSETRGALADPHGSVAVPMLHAATASGADALGLRAGRIAAGHWADFVAIDLEAPALADVDADHLPEAIVFGAGEDVIAGTAVGGRWRERATP